MTWKESEEGAILDFVGEFLKFDHPVLLREILREALRIRKRVPIYPGIVVQCLEHILDKREPAEGEEAVLFSGGEVFFGKVFVENGEKFILDELKGKIPLKGEVKRFNRRTFEELWPTLVFENED